MLRRDFLRRLVIGTAGLLVADDALELLTHKKNWPGAMLGGISETSYPRWTPHRLPAQDFTHEELKGYWDFMQAKKSRIIQAELRKSMVARNVTPVFHTRPFFEV